MVIVAKLLKSSMTSKIVKEIILVIILIWMKEQIPVDSKSALIYLLMNWIVKR